MTDWATCNCGRTMHPNGSCHFHELEFQDDGRRYTRIVWGQEDTPWGIAGSCPDCNARHGGYHHIDCDVERCPRCKGQLLSCDCPDYVTFFR